MGWTVRRARDSDAQRVAEINVLSWQHAYAGIVPAETLAGLRAEQRLPGWQRRIALPDPEAVFVAVTGQDVPAAYAAVGPSRSDGVPGAELMAIYADPAHLGGGAGHAVHEAALGYLAGQGFTEVSLWVLVDNELGRRFYARQSWQPTEHTTPVELGGATLTEIRYTRPLPAGIT